MEMTIHISPCDICMFIYHVYTCLYAHVFHASNITRSSIKLVWIIFEFILSVLEQHKGNKRTNNYSGESVQYHKYAFIDFIYESHIHLPRVLIFTYMVITPTPTIWPPGDRAKLHNLCGTRLVTGYQLEWSPLELTHNSFTCCNCIFTSGMISRICATTDVASSLKLER